MSDSKLSDTLKEISDLSRGYFLDREAERYRCLSCAAAFDRGLVHPLEGGLLASAERAAALHVETAHGGPLEALLAFGKERTGLGEIQENLIRAMAKGASDKETAHLLGGCSESNVRNHRFQLRRRAGEAKILLAAMALLADSETRSARPLEYHAALPLRDERIDVTEAEAEAIAAKYLEREPRLRLIRWPRKEKERLVVLAAVVELFERDRAYLEAEVNSILIPVHADYAMLRRYLIDYRFLSRRADGSEYRRP